jgi:uncharacterized membrane protein YbhN (UPF0104 family)
VVFLPAALFKKPFHLTLKSIFMNTNLTRTEATAAIKRFNDWQSGNGANAQFDQDMQKEYKTFLICIVITVAVIIMQIICFSCI